jgi:vacuolar-type H+-ATPase subunit E/Vma4
MGATELLARLRSDAQARVERIKIEQEQAVREVTARAEAEAERIRTENRRQADHEVERVLERAHGRARLLVRNATLAARWQVLQRVMAAAERSVLSDPGYPALIGGLVSRHAGDGAVVHLSAEDTRRFGGTLRTKPAEPVSITGGVVIQFGRRALSFVLRDAIEELCESRSSDLGRVLFGT